MCGYLFLGSAFGVMIQHAGYNFIWAFLISLTVFAGSGQFLLVSLLSGGASLPMTDVYKRQEEYQAEWVSLQTALEQNAKVFCPNARPWILRDTVVIEALLQENIPPQDSYLSPE